MRHFAHYVKRQLVYVNYSSPDDPWFKENQPEDQGFDAPVYHVTRSGTGPSTRVAKGDTLWIFSQLQAPWGMFPPALDAKITVADVVDLRERRSREDDPAFRFTAGEGSAWCPLFDATDAVRRIMTRASSGNESPLLAHERQPIGRALQRPREVAGIGPLIELKGQLDDLGFDFVSYRLVDGTKKAYQKSLELVQGGKAVFWNRWSLPRRLAERREFLSDPALDTFISGRIS